MELELHTDINVFLFIILYLYFGESMFWRKTTKSLVSSAALPSNLNFTTVLANITSASKHTYITAF